MSKENNPNKLSAPNFPAPVAADASHIEKRRAATALRRIIDGLITKHPDEGGIATLTEKLEALADELAAMPEKESRTSFGNRMTATDVRDFVEFSPIVGLSNPIAAPVRIWFEDGKAIGMVHFGKCYEGPPGFVHGGHVAAAFDELLGYVQGFSDCPGMTGTLTITYRAPTPLLTDLRLVGTYDGMEGRKIFTSGQLYAGDLLLAEAKGLFIALTEAQHDSVMRAHGQTEQRQRDGAKD